MNALTLASRSEGAAPTPGNLRRLVVLRYIVIAVVIAAILAGELWVHVYPAMPPLNTFLAALALLNVATQFRLRAAWPLTRAEFTGHLVADIVLLGGILHFAGGAANPLVSLLFLPMIFAAAMLPQAHAWAIAALAVACYGVLLATSLPLEHHVEDDLQAALSAFDLHLTGMWLTFMLTAALVAFFLTRMAQSLRARDRALARVREEALRDERIVALGTLAAGAAHELGTPLGNILLITDELERRYAEDREARAELADLRAELRRCKGILGEIVAVAGGVRAEGGRPQPADQYLDELRGQWALMRPAVRASFVWVGERPAPMVFAEQALAQALTNLFNNAADADPGGTIEVEGRCLDGSLQIEIRDRGPGITPELQARAGDIFFTRERSPNNMGLGIGLFLANATIERAGGSVRLTNREGGGAVTRVMLPLINAGKEGR